MRALCIHGHFYQPPREDPLTGIIPNEPGAAPYHNWNERILKECYRPNAELGNFEKISFNIGPTLFKWMQQYDPQTCERIVAQDQRNCERYGVGNAIAQAYNHSILPLANLRDKYTQVRWGMAAFEHYFGRKTTGMWLPETAVDSETLQVLADCGIEFTLLAPWQAAGPIPIPNQPAIVPLDGNRKIDVFFYDQDLSTRLSFDPGASVNADLFATGSLAPKYANPHGRPAEKSQLVTIASDGELYGHHQPFRDQFLAYLLGSAISSQQIKTTYPARWLKECPPRQVVHIRESTSWSCMHGVLRWSDECGCTPDGQWKAPFRKALDELGDRLNDLYLQALAPFGIDPWRLRDAYIRVLMKEEKLDALTTRLADRPLNEQELGVVGLLLESQRERQRMFTSCGWFFEDFDRIEPRNNVAYAAQAVRLARKATGIDLTPEAVRLLAAVKSKRSGLTANHVFLNVMRRAQLLEASSIGASEGVCSSASSFSN